MHFQERLLVFIA